MRLGPHAHRDLLLGVRKRHCLDAVEFGEEFSKRVCSALADERNCTTIVGCLTSTNRANDMIQTMKGDRATVGGNHGVSKSANQQAGEQQSEQGQHQNGRENHVV